MAELQGTLTLSPKERAGRTRSAVLERPFTIELHERLHADTEGETTAWHRGGLDGFEQCALGGPRRDGSTHMGYDAFFAAAISKDTDNHHFPILDGEFAPLPDR